MTGLEAFVLKILQSVLSKYVSDVIAKRISERSRAEVIDSVKAEFYRSGGVLQQVDALTVAVRELDQVVRRDSYLKWQDDRLAVEAPRRIINRKPIDIEDALAALQSSVEERRRELGEVHVDAEEGANPGGGIRLVEGAGEPVNLESEELSPWQEKVVKLGSEVRHERRKARREQDGK